MMNCKKLKKHDLVWIDNKLQFKTGFEFFNVFNKSITANSVYYDAHRFYVYDVDDDGVILADVGCFASGCNVELGKIYNVPYDWIDSVCGEIHNDDIDMLIKNKMKLTKIVYGKEILSNEHNTFSSANCINEYSINTELNDDDLDPYKIWFGDNLYCYDIDGDKFCIAIEHCKDFDDTNIHDDDEYVGMIFINDSIRTQFYMKGDELEVLNGDISFKHNFKAKEIVNISGKTKLIYQIIEAFNRIRESMFEYDDYVRAYKIIYEYENKYFCNN